jgi:hypothetical protein
MNVWTSHESLGALLGSTLGRPVKTAPVSKREIKPADLVAVYTHDQQTRAAFVCELALGAHAAAALQVFPPSRAANSIKDGRLEDDLLENLHEVFNICTQLINATSPVHVSLASVCPFQEAPQALKESLAKTPMRMQVEVDIQGYGRGRMSLALFGSSS